MVFNWSTQNLGAATITVDGVRVPYVHIAKPGPQGYVVAGVLHSNGQQQADLDGNVLTQRIEGHVRVLFE